MDEVGRRSVRDLREAVAGGDVDARGVVEQCLGEIDRLNPRLNAFVAARPQAVNEAGSVSGPLAGVPVALKDMFVDGGRAPTMGSRVHASGMSGTAHVVKRLRAAGAVIVGYANLHEWGVGLTSAFTATGPIRNPWDADHVAGGSSGGSAAALAAGVVPAAIGTDAGGSIRCPAACCGVVGFKPTWGRVPDKGFAGQRVSVDHIGPMARSVDDARLLFEVLIDESLPASDVGSLKVGVARPYFFADLDDAVGAVAEEAIPTIARMVAGVADVELAGADLARDAIGPILLPHDADMVEHDLANRPQEFHPTTERILRRGAAMSPAQRAAAEEARRRLHAAWHDLFSEVDVVVTPSLPAPPPPVDDLNVSLPSGRTSADGAFLAMNAPMNLGGVPSLSLPCGETPDRWPVSVSLTAARGRDEIVLSLGKAIEDALDRRWSDRVARSEL